MPAIKGLNTPQISRGTPLDNVFERLSKFLEVDEENSQNALTQLTNKLNHHEHKTRLQLMDLLLVESFRYISKIQQVASHQNEKEDLISISLHDMKYFNELINLIICQIIYPLIPPGIGIPLEQRRLKSFKASSNKVPKLFKYEKVRPTAESLSLLNKVIIEFKVVFNKKGDIKDLLIKSSGLTDILTALIALIHDYDPKLIEQFNYFEAQSDTYNLYGIYTAFLQTASIKYKPFISSRLTNVTMNRSNGVISLVDFIVGIRDDEEINVEKFNHVNQILLSKPKNISSVEYFTRIFDQIYHILIFINRPVLLSVIVNFVSRVYELNKRIVHDFLFKKIWSKLSPEIDTDEVLVSEKDLNDAVNVLISLTKDSTPEFLNELFSKIILNLWAYYFYLRKKKLEYAKIIHNILVSFFTITSNNEYLEIIMLNLIKTHGEGWEFQTTIENNLTSLRKTKEEKGLATEEIFDDSEFGINVITELLQELSPEMVRSQFLTVLNRWITQENNVNRLGELNPFLILIDLRLLERLNEEFKDVIMDKPQEMLQVIKNLLSSKFEDESEKNTEDSDSDDEDEEIEKVQGNPNILLELLSAVISETDPSELFKYKATLSEISEILFKHYTDKQSHALHQRIQDFLNSDKILPARDSNQEDKDTLEKAITSINDPLIPIRAHGLYLLRQLIKKKSSVLTLDFVIELHIVQIHDLEPFIYMNVIKSLNELLEFDQEGTLKYLTTYYTNGEEKNIDDRLKIGEVLLNFIIKKNELLISSQTDGLIDSLIRKTLGRVQDFEEDDRIRMSSMSLIGQAFRTNATGLKGFIKDSLDCVIGILELENEVTMQRSAVVLVDDLLSFGGLSIIPKGYGVKLKTLLEYVKLKSNDYLLVEQINSVLKNVQTLLIEKFNPSDLPEQWNRLKIRDISGK